MIQTLHNIPLSTQTKITSILRNATFSVSKKLKTAFRKANITFVLYDGWSLIYRQY